MKPQKILILGGTQFVGRSLVERLSRMPEYDVTLFNRGKSNADLFPDIKKIQGNRETEEYLKIAEQEWDCIVDFSGYYPLTFSKLLSAINGKVKKYIFISTISVFDIGKMSGAVINEDTQTLDCSAETMVSPLPDGYGEKKAAMERELLAQQGMEVVILRPSFIYGRYDWTDRLYYWLYQAVKRTEILVPAEDHNLSLTYAGDLVETLLHSIKSTAKSNVYHTISQQRTTLRQLVTIVAGLVGKSPRLVEVSDAQLETFDQNYAALPLHLPFGFEVTGDKWWLESGSKPMNFREAIRATLAYGDEIGWPAPKSGLKAEKQDSIIKALS